METIAAESVREQLRDRRRKLEEAVATVGPSEDVTRLLHEVDAALARMSTGVFGICETCHDPIEPERLAVDPLTKFCIDHLSPHEQRALEQDLDLALRIQRELLPRPDLRLDGWEFAYSYQPAAMVSGDYCDVITGTGGDVYFLVGDVAGHGVAAALLMSHLSALLRTLISLDLPLGEIMQRANRMFCDSTLGSHYATLVCGRASASGEVELCNAGHPPPLLLQGDAVLRIDSTGLPVGLFCTAQFSSVSLALSPGDALLLYTDGVLEARNTAGTEYGIERISEVVTSANRVPAAMVEASVHDLAAFRGPSRLDDDVTIVAVTRR